MDSIRKVYDITDGRRDLFHGIIFKLKIGAARTIFWFAIVAIHFNRPNRNIWPSLCVPQLLQSIFYPTFDANSFLLLPKTLIANEIR